MTADLSALRSWRDLERAASGCTLCRLHESRSQVVFGDGPEDADLLILATAPTRHEDLQGTALTGAAGNVLTNALIGAGLSRDDCFITHLVKCHPPGGRIPERDEVQTCWGYLWEQIAHLRPRVIVTLGELPTAVMLRGRVPINKVAGLRLDVFDGVTLIPTHDPAATLRGSTTAVPAIRRDLTVAKAVLDGRLGSGRQAVDEALARQADNG